MIRVLRNVLKRYCTKVPGEANATEVSKVLKIGEQTSVTKTITNEDVLHFAKLTNDYNPIHIVSTRNIVHGALLNGLLSAVIGMKLPGPGTLVVEQLIKYPAPCYVGDTIEITVEIVSVRKIVKCRYSCIANSERTVLEGEAKLIVSKAKTKKIVLMK